MAGGGRFQRRPQISDGDLEGDIGAYSFLALVLSLLPDTSTGGDEIVWQGLRCPCAHWPCWRWGLGFLVGSLLSSLTQAGRCLLNVSITF